MRIEVCDRCKAKKVEGLICRHCDTSICYDCLEYHPDNIRLCSECEQFICDECQNGIIECDIKRKVR